VTGRAAGFTRGLGTDPLKPTSSCHEDRFQKSWYEWAQVQHSIAGRADQDDAKGKVRDVLLELDVPVHGHENVEGLGGAPQ
jgi:hypothetical protein